mgnify:CR=1 FL=1
MFQEHNIVDDRMHVRKKKSDRYTHNKSKRHKRIWSTGSYDIIDIGI